MSHYFTGRGDDGTTGLLGEGRVPKFDLRIELLGTLDEASAALGLARATCQSEKIAKILVHIQKDLYQLMAEVAATPENYQRFHTIDSEKVRWLEEEIEIFGKLVKMPKDFLLPGDSQGGAVLSLARSILRRAERRAVELFQDAELAGKEGILRYLNRVSSLIFIFEIYEQYTIKGRGPTLAKDTKEKNDRNIT
jgi:cob(I)alamin adenosyltransferase